MSRLAWLAGGAVAGLLVGAAVTLSIEEITAGPGSIGLPTASEDSLQVSGEGVLVVWTPGGLPAGLRETAASLPGIEAVTVVEGDLLSLVASRDGEGRVVDRAPVGMVVPLEAIAIDAEPYVAFLPRSSATTVGALEPGEALLGATSARLRRLGAGGTIELSDGHVLSVAGVVDDALVAGAEVVVNASTADTLGIATPRYMLVRHTAAREEVERAIREALPAGAAVRFRAPGETPFLRHGDAVLPQAMVKEQFGEFAVSGAAGGEFEQEQRWQTENLVTAEIPIVGEVRCHRTVVPLLEGAMAELQARNLSSLVDPAGFGGCWNPRFIESGVGISRHAWGAAVDLNSGKNPTGLASVQDPRLVDVMERWGFTWGGDWLVPDPAHFEWVQSSSTR